jgi:hypothetical protein
MAYKITMLLEVLGDGKWHEIEQLHQLMNLYDCEIKEIMDFLNKYDFAEIDGAKKRVRLNRDFQRILSQNAV